MEKVPFAMASKRVTHHFGVLEYLKDLNKKEQKKFIQNASHDFLITISEICLNLLKGNIELSPSDLEKLRKYKSQIITLSKRKSSTKQRRIVRVLLSSNTHAEEEPWGRSSFTSQHRPRPTSLEEQEDP